MNPQDPYRQSPQQPAQTQGYQQRPNPAPPQETWPQPYANPATPQVDYQGGVSQEQRAEYSIDYLNRIAPQEQKTVNRVAIIGFIGGIVAAIIFAVVIFFSTQAPSTNNQLPTLASRVETLKTVASEQQSHLTETQISEANAALTSTLTTMHTELTKTMETRKIKQSKNSTKEEEAYLAALKKTLDDAYQKGTLDRTYTTQMTYQLTLLKSQIAKLNRSTANKELSDFCDTSISNLNKILDTYAKFEATKS
jgi:hypothetical protein